MLTQPRPRDTDSEMEGMQSLLTELHQTIDEVPGHLLSPVEHPPIWMSLRGIHHPHTFRFLQQRGLDTGDCVEPLMREATLPNWSDSPQLQYMVDCLASILFNDIPVRLFIHADADTDGIASARVVNLGILGLSQNPNLMITTHAPSRIRRWFDADRVPHGTDVLIILDQALSKDQVARIPGSVHTILHLDHHHPGNPKKFPDHMCSLNSQDLKSNLPTAGVAFMLVQSIIDLVHSSPDLAPKTKKAEHKLQELHNHCLQWAMVGIITDVASLWRGDARNIAKMGLSNFRGDIDSRAYSHRDTGLRLLCGAIGGAVSQGFLTAGHVAFQIGPCINALARIDTPESQTLRVRMASGETPTKEDAQRISALNTQRKNEQNEAELKALELFGDDESVPVRAVEIVHMDSEHAAIGGPVASRLAELTYAITGVASHPSDGETYISFRTPDTLQGVDLGEILHATADRLGFGARGGGHRQAAGLSPTGGRQQWNMEALGQLRSDIESHLPSGIYMDPIEPDIVISPSGLAHLSDMAADLWRLQPFGHGFAPPLVRVLKAYIVKDFQTPTGKHIITLADADGGEHPALLMDINTPDDYFVGLRANIDIKVEPNKPNAVSLFAVHLQPA